MTKCAPRIAWLPAMALLLASCAAGTANIRQLTSEDYYKQAQEKMAEEKYEEAKTALDEARKLYRAGDMDAQLLALLGDVHFAMKDYQEAIDVYEEFLKLHPRNAMAAHVQYRIGLSWEKLIRTRDRNPQPARRARAAYTRVMENFPHSAEAAEAAERMGTVLRALAESELFVGQFYLRKKSFQGAIGRFLTVLNDFPGVGLEEEVLYLLGESYRGLGDAAKAGEYFKLLLERYPSGDHAEEAMDFLKEGRV